MLKEKSSAIKQRLFALAEFESARRIAFYLPKGSEVDTSEMIKAAIVSGKQVLVPLTNNEIEFVEFASFDDLPRGKYRILEPKIRDPKHKTLVPDIVILPGLAFDLDLHRLGYGKGYYDRVLKKLPDATRIGICFDCQIVEAIPKHEHDERLHMIISESRILRLV